MFNLRVIEPHTPGHLRVELEKMGADPGLLQDHIAKGALDIVKLERVSPRLARFLYQELLLEGGDALLASARAENGRESGAPSADVLLLGTRYQLGHLAIRLRTQGEGELNLLADELESALAACGETRPAPFTIGGTRFEWGRRTYVMGIVNVTPDSFSGDGILASAPEDYAENAVARAQTLIEEGADVIDLGGESTRPGSQPAPADEEYRRVIPVLERLRPKVRVPISIDTYKAEIARAALDVGADLVNDVWGLRMDPALKRVVAERGVPVVVMHNRSQPKDAAQSERLGGRYVGVHYDDLVGDVIRELREQIDIALDAGIASDKIIVDPGIGFGKTVEQNLELVNRVGELRVLGRPILLGPSRKGFIGYTLDLPPDERIEGTAAAVAASILRGVDIVRVHDVRQMVRVAKMTDAIVKKGLTSRD